MLSNGCTIRLSGDFCDIYLPVYPDYEKDTPETIRQIDKNNIVYQKCMINNKSLRFAGGFSVRPSFEKG